MAISAFQGRGNSPSIQRCHLACALKKLMGERNCIWLLDLELLSPLCVDGVAPSASQRRTVHGNSASACHIQKEKKIPVNKKKNPFLRSHKSFVLSDLNTEPCMAFPLAAGVWKKKILLTFWWWDSPLLPPPVFCVCPTNIANVNLVMGCSKGFFFTILTAALAY